MRRHQDEVVVMLVYLLGILWIAAGRLCGVGLVLCPTKWLMGIPCPGCGMTRAANLLLDGDAVGALRMNPNIAIATILAILAPPLLIGSLVGRHNIIERINHRLDTPWFLVPFALFELVVWVYNIYRGV